MTEREGRVAPSGRGAGEEATAPPALLTGRNFAIQAPAAASSEMARSRRDKESIFTKEKSI